MTETRKEIIGLIEPYMNKELSEGCIVKYCNQWYIHIYDAYCTIIRKKLVKNTYSEQSFNPWKGNIVKDKLWDTELWISFYKNSDKKWFYDYHRMEYKTIWEFWDISDYTDNLWVIIWHYDITAVEKYIIGEEEKYIEVKPVYKHIFSWNWDDYLWKFPNKPLHLFSNTEEEELLELLKKLK